MPFESALFRPSAGTYDVDAVRTHLASLPFAFRDGDRFHLSATVREARANAAARQADPERFPPGVLVEPRPDGVLVDQSPLPDALARGKELVAWLYGLGEWQVRTEAGDQGRPSVDALYPGPLPDPASLVDDPLTSPPPWGVLWSWRTGDDTLLVHDTGAIRLETADVTVDARLEPVALAAWGEATGGLDPDDVDATVDDPALTASLSRETPDTEASVYFDARSPPHELAAVATLVDRWSEALRAWSPGRPSPKELVVLGR